MWAVSQCPNNSIGVGVLTKLQSDLVPLLDVLQVARDEVIEPPDEVALLVRCAIQTVPVLCRLGLDADAQGMLEEQLCYDRVVAQVDTVLREMYE